MGVTFPNESPAYRAARNQLLQRGQKKWRVSPWRPPTTGLPAVTSKPALGIARVSEKALAAIRWQLVQWQADARSRGALTRIRVWSQRQPSAQVSSTRSC